MTDKQRLIVLHNAGSLGRVGDVSAARTPTNQLSSDVCLNVTSFTALTEALLCGTATHNTTFVNVSSHAAVQPFPSLAQYCLWKSARELYMATLAEECQDGTVRTLNYSPGPMKTAMTHGLSENPAFNADLRRFYDQLEREVHTYSTSYPLQCAVMTIAVCTGIVHGCGSVGRPLCPHCHHKCL